MNEPTLEEKLEGQRSAVHSLVSVAVTAGAGTGKSHMLAERFLHHLENRLSPLEVVAVTFTEKAAAELRARIRKLVAARLPGEADVLAELEFAQISTIHALAARICRDHWQAAGVSPDFTILDELEGQIRNAQWLDEALDRLPSYIYAKVPHSTLLSILQLFFDDPVTAERALVHGPDGWAALVEQARKDAINDLVGKRAWLEAHNTLRELSGKAGDKLEDWRRLSLEAVVAIERGDSPRQHLEVIAGVKLNVGSAKLWSNGGLAAVKEALRVLRDECVKPALNAGLTTLELGVADERLSELIPILRDAFKQVREYVAAAKRRAGVLDFADLEECALRALENAEVRAHYAGRWKAILVDEFQDTNPIQAELLQRLTAEGVLTTIVGDEKQSIYGFRRADVSVFRRVRERITSIGGESHALSVSFRTHAELTNNLNTVFAAVLGEMHQSLDASRADAPHPGPHLRAYTVQAEKGIRKAQRQLAEARHIAQSIKQMLDEKRLVHDKITGDLRAVRPGDFAVLSRTWEPLDLCGDVIENHGIPVIHAGGGNLLDTREAKDAWVMLRFLADPTDDLALVAVLRSPFFAVSDRELLAIGEHLPQGVSWWSRVQISPQLNHAADVLGELVKRRRIESPSRLLQLANRLTGYCAVIANLPGAERREADWRGFFELVLKLERSITDISVLVRQIRRLIDSEVKVPRPVVEAQDAVSLMTIHGSKGLEWPVVIVPDLARESPGGSKPAYFDDGLGVAFELEDDKGDPQTPALFTLLKHKHDKRELEEAKRVMYVALTRARDHVILCSTEAKGGGLDLLLPGLDAAQVYFEPIPFDPELDLLRPPADPPTFACSVEHYVDQIGFAFSELPILALNEYGLCPARFRFNHHDGHPGFDDEVSLVDRLTKLVRKAIELDINDERSLARFDPSLPGESVREALALASRFQNDLHFASLRGDDVEVRTKQIALQHGAVTLHGTVDVVGGDFVVAFDCSHEVLPEHHHLKLWAFAKATGKSVAHLVSLRHNQIHTFDADSLVAIESHVDELLKNLMNGHYHASPSLAACRCCLYSGICDDRYQIDAGSDGT
jgi:ATP-dependent helicase/nuclease subunit A